MKNTLKIYIGFSLFIILLYILALFDIYLKGSITAPIIVLIWIISTLFIIIKNWKTKGIKIYALILFLLTVLSILPMAIPFLIIISFLFNLDHTSYYQLDKTHELKKAKYILSKEKLYVLEQQNDYFIFEQSKSIGSIDYEEAILQMFPQNPFETNPNNYQLTEAKLFEIDDESVSVQLKINNKKEVIEIPIKK